MALLSPLLLIWPDERVLLVAQVASVAVAGLFLALILYRHHPRLAPWFLLAFYLNPALHSLTLFEFRRVVLVMPFMALALFALDRQKRLLMLAALLMALLGKEDIGLFVAGVGLYLLIIKRDVWWGLGLLILGLGWATIVSLWVIPLFRTPGSEYPQLFYFDYLGSSYGEMLGTIQRDPLILFRQLFSIDRLAALGRLLLPLGLFLPFLAANWLLIAVPTLTLLLLSGDAEMFGLLKWYPAPILPVLFAATAAGLSRFPLSRARLLTVWLLFATILSYFLFSPLPGGRAYEPALYDVTGHQLQALAMVELVPQEASIATQPHVVPHLIQRENVYHYPWIKIGQENIDYFLFDSLSDSYPFSKDEFNIELTKFLVDPAYALVAQTDDIYLLQQNGRNEPEFSANQTAEEAVQLYGFDIAIQDEDGFYRAVSELPASINPGGRLRIILYWQAVATPEAERTVSLHLLDSAGQLVAQHDGLPGAGSRPTSFWQAGQQVRDIHLLEIPADLAPGALNLQLLLYDTFTQERVPFNDGQENFQLGQINIQDQTLPNPD